MCGTTRLPRVRPKVGFGERARSLVDVRCFMCHAQHRNRTVSESRAGVRSQGPFSQSRGVSRIERSLETTGSSLSPSQSQPCFEPPRTVSV